MRMKEDHMQNNRLKTGYNLQLSTSNQCIVHFSLHQQSTDTTTLIPHFDSFKTLYDRLPEAITADAGYGSEENYAWLEAQQIRGYVKYDYFTQGAAQILKTTTSKTYGG